MALRRTPNPSRNFPTHCPYCGSMLLTPHEVDEFGWRCEECLRVFSIRFHGQDDPESRPRPTVSTHEAYEKSRRESTKPEATR